jgi:hypothetical protein
MAPEKILVLILAVLLAATFWLLAVPMDLDSAVRGARAVCVALAVLLVLGLIVPWRRRLARRREDERRRAEAATADPAKECRP